MVPGTAVSSGATNNSFSYGILQIDDSLALQ